MSNTETMVGVPRYSLEAARDCLVICQDQAFRSCECESCPECGLMPDECTGTECAKTCQCTTCEHCMNKDSIESLTAILSQPAEPPQGEPMHQSRYLGAADGWRDVDRKQYEERAVQPNYQVRILFTHADLGEVERLREQLTEAQECYRSIAMRSDVAASALNEQAAELKQARSLLRESYAEFLAIKAEIGFRGATIALIGRLDAALSAIADPSAPECCKPTAEEEALLSAGDYTPEELWGGSRPTCPKCIKTEPRALPDPLDCRSCTHPDCAKFDGPRQVECRAMADNACARPDVAEPSAPVEREPLVSEDELRDMAASACASALAHGVNEDWFLRLARTVEQRARAALARKP